MKKKNKAVWGSRFNNATSKIFEKIGASIDVDKRLFEEDILGSTVHTQMLIRQKIIVKKKKKRCHLVISVISVISLSLSLSLSLTTGSKVPKCNEK